jgi:hypothetical protein
MHRDLCSLALASILASGCASTAALAPATPASDATKISTTDETAKTASAEKTTDDAAKAADATPADTTAAAQTPATTADDTSARKPGDFIVYRFSGSFRKAPLTLTERVIDRRGATLTVDFTADDGSTKRELRVKIDEASSTKNDVVAVARVEGGAEKPATIADFEALMAETALAADENEARLGAEDTTLAFGGAPLAVRKTSYRVRVGKKHATLRTLESDGFAWGDLGGEITAGSKVLYKAEVIDLGHTDLGAGKAVADAQ